MITKNDAAADKFNGETYTLDEACMIKQDKTHKPHYPDARVTLDGEVTATSSYYIEAGYVITVHKSQGSQADSLAILLPRNWESSSFITKELLYTAVTRAKKRLVVVLV